LNNISNKNCAALFLITGLFFLFCNSVAFSQIQTEEEDKEIILGVAASMSNVSNELSQSWHYNGQKESVTISSASSGSLQQQARQSAPYDIILFADDYRADELLAEGIGTRSFELPSNVMVFVSWKPIDDIELKTHIESLDRIAFANSETAPFGQAAKNWLDEKQISDEKVEFIIGQNVQTALQYFIEKEVDGAFIAKSLLTYWDNEEANVSESLQLIPNKGLAINENEKVNSFVEHLIESRSIWREHGFEFERVTSQEFAKTERGNFYSLVISPLLITIQVAFFSTLLAFVIGTSLAYVLYNKSGMVSRFFENLILLPLVLPPTVLGFYLLVMISSQSPLGQFYESIFGSPLAFTKTAAVLAATIGAFPFVARQMIAGFRSLPTDSLEAAKIDGAGSWKLLSMILLPLVRPSIISSLSLALAKSIGDFGATVMVAASIPGKTQTASLAIYDSVIAGDWPHAYLLSGILIVLSFFLLYFTSFIDYDRVKENKVRKVSSN